MGAGVLRFWTAAACLLASLAICIALLAWPALKPDKPGIVAILLLASGLILLGRRAWYRPRRGCWLLLAAALLIFPFAVIYRAFGEIDMMSLLFHVNVGTAGLSPMVFDREILAVAASLIVLCLCTYVLAGLPWFRHLPWLCGGILLLFNPLLVYYLVGVFLPAPKVDLSTEIVALPALDLRADARAPDIVHLYLEGVDRRFLQIAPEGPGAQGLRQLEAQGLSLQNIGQIAGTGWSLAGVVASQCGLPLMPRGNLTNTLSDTARERFMPLYTCLPDLLRQAGYRLSFIMGTTREFAGIAFFKTHGYETFFTSENFHDIVPEQELAGALTTGGFYDDAQVYDVARRHFIRELAQAAPIALTVETMGPHGIPSYLSRSCSASGQPETITSVGPAVDCLVGLTTDFVAELQQLHAQSGRGRPLRIIVQSDHLNHSKLAVPFMAEHRRNFIVLIGGAEVGVVNHQLGSMLDVYPSLLNWLGIAPGLTRAGMGVSLMGEGEAQTLVARFGFAPLDRILWRSHRLYDLLWQQSK